jgi:hypothetical protein
LGACADGVGVCDAGEYSCEQQVFPSDEVCDSVDNDCDGEEDEDDGQGTCGADCESIGFERLVQGEVVLCYSDQAGVCQDVHGACESLGDGYRLMCGDHWQPGKDGQGCGGNGSYTAYDFVNQHFPGSAAFGAYSQGRENCVRGGQNNSCNGDVGNQDDWNTNGNYGVCAPQNFFMAAQDGEAWANVCGS